MGTTQEALAWRPVYVVVSFDYPEDISYKRLSKLLISSMLRFRITHDIVLIKNWKEQSFLRSIPQLSEIYINVLPIQGDDLTAEATIWRVIFQDLVDLSKYSHIVFLDADCLVLGPIGNYGWSHEIGVVGADPYLAPGKGCSVIQVQTFLCIRRKLESLIAAKRFSGLAETISQLQDPIKVDADLIVHDLTSASVLSMCTTRAPICHAPACSKEQKVKLNTGLYLSQFFYSSKYSIVDILDM